MASEELPVPNNAATIDNDPGIPVILFGYNSSTFTIKIRACLLLKQIPYTFIPVPSMPPRHLLTSHFSLPYRRIPILAIGREVYCDTSLIIEALEHFFPSSEGYPSLYPPTSGGEDYRGLLRSLTSWWADRALFRVMTGLIPEEVWRTSFGEDRGKLIGHPLDAEKLGKKRSENLARLDTQLSILEPVLTTNDETRKTWLLPTDSPSLADVAVYTQLHWGTQIAKGHFVADITGGQAQDTDTEGADAVWNSERYPKLWRWFKLMHRYLETLEVMEETKADGEAFERDGVLSRMKMSPALGKRSLLLPTSRKILPALEEEKVGLKEGTAVAVVPDDTGRDSPTVGTLIAMSPEEVVIKPQPIDGSDDPKRVDVRVHFPKVGFTIRPADRPKL
ncbi:hypothetical protein K431DRAFT_259934 [Polychaeton citri CBS 116435]|uniref:GST N-terminal domain-containing protein n=1 Tax=Polychaeton citri CBS 116435 TaxID=1314669 RepID=A0A9P4QJG1_9PEZI|nr:hypothetical protein K431DRAFT_259934 [Polychaeton citri CBS 116435]